jgi:hypothetical protein
VLTEVDDMEFLDSFAMTLITEYEEKGNNDVARALMDLYDEGSRIFEISHQFLFAFSYCKFKQIVIFFF